MSQPVPALPRRRLMDRFLDVIEAAGNKLPDPAALFVLALFITWAVSVLLAPVNFSEIDPRTGQPIRIVNQLTGPELVKFLSGMVKTFVGFPPLGIVLVAMLGVGVAEHTGFINALIKGLLNVTPRRLLTPMVLLVAIVSHSAGDTGFVLVIPLGGVIFAAGGRHPLVGVIAAFAGVSGGFSANFLPSSLDPLLQGFTQSAAQILESGRAVNPLCNWGFMSASCVFIIGLGWYITDRMIEPRLSQVPVDGDPADMPRLDPLTRRERLGMFAGLSVIVVAGGLLTVASLPADSTFRPPSGDLTAHDSPLMMSIVPLIFLLFFVPGIVHGYVAGTVRSHRDVVMGMKKAMDSMGYYLVMAFWASLFTAAFRESNLGTLLAIKGANGLRAMGLPPMLTIVGIIGISAGVNLLIASASAKWALLAPIFVPMLMRIGISPELTQVAFRIGDSSTNIITPLMAYFPLILVYCQRYVKGMGLGTLISLMVPYSIGFITCWTVFLMVYWWLGLPLGLGASYTL